MEQHSAYKFLLSFHTYFFPFSPKQHPPITQAG